jgi:hypothetical protein
MLQRWMGRIVVLLILGGVILILALTENPDPSGPVARRDAPRCRRVPDDLGP